MNRLKFAALPQRGAWSVVTAKRDTTDTVIMIENCGECSLHIDDLETGRSTTVLQMWPEHAIKKKPPR